MSNRKVGYTTNHQPYNTYTKRGTCQARRGRERTEKSTYPQSDVSSPCAYGGGGSPLGFFSHRRCLETVQLRHEELLREVQKVRKRLHNRTLQPPRAPPRCPLVHRRQPPLFIGWNTRRTSGSKEEACIGSMFDVTAIAV